jgi:VIT1/CCC1 family predicted Fe2+/Mn2+ transporter
MSSHLKSEDFESQHNPEAIAQRLAETASHSYLGDFVLGAIDGVVTTFAVVAGVAGAGYSASVALVLGAANLLADGFSMAAGNYLSSKSNRQIVEQVREVERRHIETIPEGEREEIRQIFAAKGFDGDLLDQIVDVITSDRRRWIDTMVTEEFGLQLHPPSPIRAGATTFVAFVVAGFVPLIPYCLPGDIDAEALFAASTALAAATFFSVGWAKGRELDHSRWFSGLETTLIGGGAASLAYIVGLLLRSLVPEAATL